MKQSYIKKPLFALVRTRKIVQLQNWKGEYETKTAYCWEIIEENVPDAHITEYMRQEQTMPEYYKVVKYYDDNKEELYGRQC